MNLNCVICAELFSSSDDVYVTSCGHIFHHVCLQQWLERSRTCPQCRHRCNEKHIHKIYFNIANIDASRIDVGTLQQQLENSELKNKCTEKDLQKAQNEIQEIKNTQKKTMKTITALEKKVEQKNFLILSFNEQMNILKAENKVVDSLKKEVKELKNQIELMTSVQTVVTATASEVEKLLKEDNSPKTLSNWVTTLKRELKICESKKIDLRNTLKVVQHDLRKERDAKMALEERIVQLESENYRLTEKAKELDQQKENPTTVFAKNAEDLTLLLPSCSLTPTTATTTKKVRLLDSTNMPSPTLSEKVKKIEDSDSPYLNIKQSGVGLGPLLKLGVKNRKIEGNKVAATNTIKNHSNDLSSEYSIFKKPRLFVQSTRLESKNKNFNGVGGSESVFNYDFLRNDLNEEASLEKPKSISSRIKSGKLRKIPSAGNQSLAKFLEKH